jgi:H/ACA ribonucleoprotein complex non-core subunit NAF1
VLPTPKALKNDSSSDSDSSSSSSDVEMRVTRYPAATRAKHLASLTALTRPADYDAEDEDDAPHGSSTQYAGTKNEVLAPEVEVPEITEVPVDDVLERIGEIMTIIDSVVVAKGNTTGVHRALDTDSLLVFEDRKVLGKVRFISAQPSLDTIPHQPRFLRRSEPSSNHYTAFGFPLPR